MIANVGPADYNYDETMNTLRYASRAKNIQNKPRINEDPKDALLREYQEEITKLKEQLNALNQGRTPDEVMAMQGVVSGQQKTEVVMDHEKMREFEERLAAEKEEIKQKAEQERLAIENQAHLKEEEKKKLLEELRSQEEAKEKAKTKQQKLVKKLQKMKEKMLVGSQVIEVAKKQ